MKIAFILSGPILVPTNGVISQALTWKEGLTKLGHEVSLIEMWSKNDWEEFDIIHFFGFSVYMKDLINGLKLTNPNIVVSPILDPYYSKLRLKIYANFGSTKFNLSNQYHALNQAKRNIKLFLARSEFERDYLVEGFHLNSEQCRIVPLSFGNINTDPEHTKEDFCFHLSLLADKRKNVKRLIEAAQKYNFKLVLAGKLRNNGEYEQLKEWMNNHPLVEYRGLVSHEEKLSLFARAKVFALPSIYEGVGIVALEAAAMGCDIVITKLGGPKEYYNGLASPVAPYNVDEIGKSIKDFIDNRTNQPDLKQHIIATYSPLAIAERLAKVYEEII